MNKFKYAVLVACSMCVIIVGSIILFGGDGSKTQPNRANFKFKESINVISVQEQEKIFEDLIIVGDDFDYSGFKASNSSEVRYRNVSESIDGTEEETELPDNLCELEEFACIEFVASKDNPLYDYEEGDVIYFIGSDEETEYGITVESVRPDENGRKLFEVRYALADEVYSEIDYFQDLNDEYEDLARLIEEAANTSSTSPGSEGALAFEIEYYSTDRNLYTKARFVVYTSTAEMKLCTSVYNVGKGCSQYDSTYFLAQIGFEYGYEFEAQYKSESPIKYQGKTYNFSIGITVADSALGGTAYFETLSDFKKYVRPSNIGNPILLGLQDAEENDDVEELLSYRKVFAGGITIHMDLLLGVEVDLEGTIGVEQSQKFYTTVGVELKDGKTYKINEAGQAAARTSLYAEGEVNGDVYLYARFGIGYFSKTPYVAAGPKAGIKFEANGRAEIYRNVNELGEEVNYCLQAGASADAYVSVVGEASLRLNLWFYKKTLIKVELEKEIISKNIFDLQVPIGTIIPGSDSCIIVDNMTSADNLIEAIKANPGGNFYLNANITVTPEQLRQFSEIDFKGTLDGNGHKLIFSSGSSSRCSCEIMYLFESIESGSILNNLVIETEIPFTITKRNYGSITNPSITLNTSYDIDNKHFKLVIINI